jgi:type II secretory pathway pseudopilin PulG
MRSFCAEGALRRGKGPGGASGVLAVAQGAPRRGSGAGGAPDPRRVRGPQVRGFALLEAVIALAIIGVVAVGVLASTAGQVRSADKAGGLVVARALAEDRTTAFRLLGYEELRRPADSLLAGRFSPPFDEYSWTARVVETEGENDLFTIDVVTEGRGERFPIQTLLHRPRPQILVSQ